jgi:hypothetical protein
MSTPPKVQPPFSSSDQDGKDYVVIQSPLDESLLFCNRWKCVYCHRTIWRQSRFLLRVDGPGEKKTAKHTCHEKRCDRLQKSRQSGTPAGVLEERVSRNNWKYLVGVLSFVSVAALVSLGVVIGSNASKGPSPGEDPTRSSTLSPSVPFADSASGDRQPPPTSAPSTRGVSLTQEPRSSSGNPVTTAVSSPPARITLAPVTVTPTRSPSAAGSPTAPPVAPVPPSAVPTLVGKTSSPMSASPDFGPTFLSRTATPGARPPSFQDWWATLDPDFTEAADVPNSAQWQARSWTESTIQTAPAYSHVQRYALAVLYYSTGGDMWTNATLWLTKAFECQWLCSSGIMCRSGGRISNLVFTQNNLTGSIPRELALLTNLQVLEIAESTGSLSVEMPDR